MCKQISNGVNNVYPNLFRRWLIQFVLQNKGWMSAEMAILLYSNQSVIFVRSKQLEFGICLDEYLIFNELHLAKISLSNSLVEFVDERSWCRFSLLDSSRVFDIKS